MTKLITFDSRIWAPDRDCVLVCEEDETVSSANPSLFEPLPIPSLELRKKKSIFKWAFPLSVAFAGLWCFSRFAKEDNFEKEKKWGSAVSAVTGGHPEDINGM